ncbi:hypothetical protein [Kineosporia babensis]|uniref:Uncharacterized protein n=1 Tax=Kineosporia babensis TaxID=499548 RepID=A0A9X1NME2_9ACTN|nr:hypothetical protein [Kineosporia babensis]MCD5316396.1 hypothetical protein [Kineosporia babensis]
MSKPETEAAPAAPPPEPGSRPEPEVKRLSGRGLLWRALALAVGTLLIVNGSVYGNDTHWPFASMGQFAFRVGDNDSIRSTFLAAVDEDGNLQRVALSHNNIGIARAEVEGQQRNFILEPQMLSALAENYARRHPGSPELVQLWLCQDITELYKGRERGTSIETMVGWPANTLIPESLPEPGGEKVAVDLDAPENSRPNTDESTGQSGQESR